MLIHVLWDAKGVPFRVLELHCFQRAELSSWHSRLMTYYNLFSLWVSSQTSVAVTQHEGTIWPDSLDGCLSCNFPKMQFSCFFPCLEMWRDLDISNFLTRQKSSFWSAVFLSTNEIVCIKTFLLIDFWKAVHSAYSQYVFGHQSHTKYFFFWLRTLRAR